MSSIIDKDSTTQMSSLNNSFIIAWKVGREFMRPKNIDPEGSKHPSVGFEGSLPFSTQGGYVHCYIPVDIELGEDLSVFEFVNDIRDKGADIDFSHK